MAARGSCSAPSLWPPGCSSASIGSACRARSSHWIATATAPTRSQRSGRPPPRLRGGRRRAHAPVTAGPPPVRARRTGPSAVGRERQASRFPRSRASRNRAPLRRSKAAARWSSSRALSPARPSCRRLRPRLPVHSRSRFPRSSCPSCPSCRRCRRFLSCLRCLRCLRCLGRLGCLGRVECLRGLRRLRRIKCF